ncbi:MAG: ribosome-associated translation inhibitor RaiA [Pseudomonadota bacterium]
MQVAVTFRHMEPSAPLRDYATDKVVKVKKYLEDPIECHVVLSVEKHRHAADVTVVADGFKVNGQETTGDMYSSIDMAVDKIEKQIKKYREKLRQRVAGRPEPSAPEGGEAVVEEAAGTPARIIRTESYRMKPMHPEEALLELESSEDDFIVFTNAESERVSVLYRRKDGNFGLIEPEA